MVKNNKINMKNHYWLNSCMNKNILGSVRWGNMKIKNPVIRVVDRKLCINEIVFEHDQLRESKEYLQSLGYTEVIFYPENDEDINELEEVMSVMSKKNCESAGKEIPTYYLN